MPIPESIPNSRIWERQLLISTTKGKFSQLVQATACSAFPWFFIHFKLISEFQFSIINANMILKWFIIKRFWVEFIHWHWQMVWSSMETSFGSIKRGDFMLPKHAFKSKFEAFVVWEGLETGLQFGKASKLQMENALSRRYSLNHMFVLLFLDTP